MGEERQVSGFFAEFGTNSGAGKIAANGHLAGLLAGPCLTWHGGNVKEARL
jgi:hypothetical protein